MLLLFLVVICRSSIQNSRREFYCLLLRGGVSSRKHWKKRGYRSRVALSRGTRIRGHNLGFNNTEDYVRESFGFDSCANVHYVGNKSLLHDYREVRGITVDGLGGAAVVLGVGTLRARMRTNNGEWCDVLIPDVFYIEGCEASIISAHLFLSQTEHIVKKYVVPNDGAGLCPYLKLTNHLKVNLEVRNNVSCIDLNLSTKKDDVKYVSRMARVAAQSSFYCDRTVSMLCGYETQRNVDTSIDYAHMVLCHPSKKKMEYAAKHNFLDGLSWVDGKLSTCYPCSIGKSALNPRTSNARKFQYRGQLVVTDIEGPIGVEAFGGYQYAIHFTDMYSRFSVVYLMKRKSEAGNCLEKYLKYHCSPLSVTVDMIQSDNAKEYVGENCEFQKICRKNKITSRASSPYCHWENGAAERVIRTMTAKAFTVMAQRDLSSAYWGNALEHVYYMENVLPHRAFDNKESPYIRWYEHKPDLANFHTFGCDVRCYVPTDAPKRVKFVNPPAWMGIYVGELADSSSHKVYRSGQDGNPGTVEHVGDRLCKFYEAYDPNLYLKSYDDPIYQKYLRADGSVVDEIPQPTSRSFRICKRFAKDIFFATVTPNVEGGEFTFNVAYDDGDFEHMTPEEIKQGRALFASVEQTDPRAQGQFGTDTYGVLPGKVKLIDVMDHKVFVNNFSPNVQEDPLEPVTRK